MFSEKTLAKICREIARNSDGETDIRKYIQALSDADWTVIATEDRMTRKGLCKSCGKVGLWKNFIGVVDEWSHDCRLCSVCYSKLIVSCLVCGTSYYPSMTYPSKECVCAACQNKKISDDRTKFLEGVDYEKYRHESVKVSLHIGRSTLAGLPSTLKTDHWIITLKYFNWMCAYCLASPYEDLEHFVPISKGGGTTFNNCVPACNVCNKLKNQQHPDRVTTISQDALIRVLLYLDNL